jgi:hypothetical protein
LAAAFGFFLAGCTGHELGRGPADAAVEDDTGAPDLAGDGVVDVPADVPSAADVAVVAADALDAAVDDRAAAADAGSDARLPCGDATCAGAELCVHQMNRGGGLQPVPDSGVCPSGSVMMSGPQRWCEGHSESFRCAIPPACDGGPECACNVCMGCMCPGASTGQPVECTCIVP